MSVPVYLAKLAVKNPSDHRLAKIKRLCDAVGLADKVKPLGTVGEDEVVAIKLHFGEAGNDTYLHPTFVRQVVDCVKATGARPFLTDTCTLYKSTRHNAVDHLETAYRHGFTPYVVDAPVIMADGVTSKCYEEVAVNLKHFASVKIAQAFLSANAMVVLSHFKGHAMGGFGGAIKNLAMGCAPQAGKIDQHGRNVVIYPKCIGCGQCVKGKEGRICYLNFLLNVTPQCDCAGWSEPAIVPDLGILASEDPVALDTACFDLVKEAHSLIPLGEHGAHSCGYDKFSALHPNTRGWHQVEYAESIGMGSRDYELITV